MLFCPDKRWYIRNGWQRKNFITVRTSEGYMPEESLLSAACSEGKEGNGNSDIIYPGIRPCRIKGSGKQNRNGSCLRTQWIRRHFVHSWQIWNWLGIATATAPGPKKRHACGRMPAATTFSYGQRSKSANLSERLQADGRFIINSRRQICDRFIINNLQTRIIYGKVLYDRFHL